MNSFIQTVSVIRAGYGGRMSFASTIAIWKGVSLLLLAAFFVGSSAVSAQSIYRSVVESDGSTAGISVQPGDTFTVSFGLDYLGVVAGTTRADDNELLTFGIDARVFEFDATIGNNEPPVIDVLGVESAARGADVPAEIGVNAYAVRTDALTNAALVTYTLGQQGGFRLPCNVDGCDLRNLLTVTYRVAEDASPAAYKIGSITGFLSGQDTQEMGDPQVQRDELIVYVVQPEILAELRLNSGAPGGTLELTAVTPVNSTDTTLVAASGRTCLEIGTCEVDTSFSTPVTVVIPAGTFLSPVSSCGTTICTRRSGEQNLDITLGVAAARFSNGMASVAGSTTLQYDLENITDGDGLFVVEIMVDGDTSPMLVTVVADQTPPTVPEGFALSCTPTAYSAVCSWPAGAEDPSPGAGLADFQVTLFFDNPAEPELELPPASCMTSLLFPEAAISTQSATATTDAASVEFADPFRTIPIEQNEIYIACLTVEDKAGNPAAGSPFQVNFMTPAYQRGVDVDPANGVPDDLDVFDDYTDLAEAVRLLNQDADNSGRPDSIVFAYGIRDLPRFLEPGEDPEELTCHPDYARRAAANLETSCADVLGGRMGWIIHVANGVLFTPTTAPLLAEMPRASGKYLISHLNEDRTIASLVVLVVLPQLGISYPVDGEGLALAPPDENPRDANPANDAAEPNDPTKFQVAVLFGDGIPGEDSQDGAIPTTVTLSLATIVHAPATEPEPMPTPSVSSLTALTVAVATLASTDAELVEHTGIHMAPANTVMLTFRSIDGRDVNVENVNALATSFTLADSDITDLDFIRIMLMDMDDVVGASTQTNIACSTPQEGGDLVGAPPEVTPDEFSCTVPVGGSIFEPGEEGIVEIAGSGGGGGMLGWLSLVALAALTMLSGLVRRRGIALAAALFLSAGLSPAAFAQLSTLSDPSHWRLGVDIGLGLIEPDSPNDEDNVFDVDDDSDFGWRISVEHDSLFHKDVGLEIFWADLGEAEIADREEPELNGEVEADVFGIGAVWHLRDLNFLADWSPYGSLGYRYVDGDLSGNFADNFDVDSESGVYWNIGVEGSVYRDWNLLGRAFYEAYDEDLGFWGVGLVWHLGESSAPPRKRDKPRRSASRKKAEPSSARRESSRRVASSRRDMAAAGECKVPKGMTPEGWYVQVITYASADRARSMQNQLRRDDYTVGVADRGDLHAVRVLTDTCAQAQRIKRQLGRKLGVEPFVRPYTSHAY